MERTRWYKEAVIYQIYPRSFMDSNGDGIGDIPGIIMRLDHLKDLGVNAVWLSPVYDSPNDDNGYDIRNYRDILKEFGTLDDWKAMIQAMHERGIRLIMDFVGNHTSDEHVWFQEAISDSKSPYRDYYFIRSGKSGGNPNNWSSFFGGDAWEKLPNQSSDYYMHLFTKKQPDLNWDTPAVREEMKDILKFWFDLGVDGFRCDVITLISKNQALPDGKKGIALQGREHYISGPRIHEFLHELNRDVFSKYDSMTVGESVLMSAEEAPDFVNENREELDMVFSFDHMSVDNYMGVKWFMRRFRLIRLKKAMAKWQHALMNQGWNSLYLENHDQPRSIGRFGTTEEQRVIGAKMLATMMYFHQGTPYIYQGQEIGMTNAHFTSLDQIKDTETHTIYALGRKLHIPNWYLQKALKLRSRDNSRTPMQWDATKNAGFTSGTPWIEVIANYPEINVEQAKQNQDSIFHYYKKLLQIRASYDVALFGDYQEYDLADPSCYVYGRKYLQEMMLVVSNFTGNTKSWRIPSEYRDKLGEVILSNYPVQTSLLLRPYESRVYYYKKSDTL